MKIIDCFIFYNELDLLKYRLDILHTVVDYFVIVESTHTFTGKPKQMYYDLVDASIHKDKMIHVIVDDLPYIAPNMDIGQGHQWKNEEFQRNAIARGIQKVPALSADDVIIITDVDEIPDPRILYTIKHGGIAVDFYNLLMDFYYYNLNTHTGEIWHMGKMLTYAKYRELNMSCQSIRAAPSNGSFRCGWHLSYFGDSKFIRNKIQHFSHQELNHANFTDLDKIEKRVSGGHDLYDRATNMRHIDINDNPYLPPLYNVYLTKYYK